MGDGLMDRATLGRCIPEGPACASGTGAGRAGGGFTVLAGTGWASEGRRESMRLGLAPLCPADLPDPAVLLLLLAVGRLTCSRRELVLMGEGPGGLGKPLRRASEHAARHNLVFSASMRARSFLSSLDILPGSLGGSIAEVSGVILPEVDSAVK